MPRAFSNAPGGPAEQLILRALGENGELSVASLRALSPLSDKAQVLVDKAVVDVGMQRLTIVADILAAGLTYPLTDPLSVTEIEWESVNQTGGAQRTMVPSARGERQMPNRLVYRLPIYLTTDDFSLGIRTLKMSQRVGTPLDTSLIQQATRRVNESFEDAMINGATDTSGIAINVGGYAAPGLLNAPHANTYVYQGGSAGLAWDDPTKTGQNILDDFQAMVEILQGDLKWGPYNFYVPTKYDNKLNQDFKTNGTLTIRQRLEQLTFGGRPVVIKAADQMPANKTVLFQATNDVVEIVNGMAPTVFPWTSPDGWTLYWMIMGVMIPRVRADYNGNSGIVIGYTS